MKNFCKKWKAYHTWLKKTVVLSSPEPKISAWYWLSWWSFRLLKKLNISAPRPHLFLPPSWCKENIYFPQILKQQKPVSVFLSQWILYWSPACAEGKSNLQTWEFSSLWSHLLVAWGNKVIKVLLTLLLLERKEVGKILVYACPNSLFASLSNASVFEGWVEEMVKGIFKEILGICKLSFERWKQKRPWWVSYW